MSTAKRFVVGAGLVAFLAALVARPVRSNPAATGFLSGSLDTAEVLLLVPTLLVAVLLVVSRVRRVLDDEQTDDTRYEVADDAWNSRESAWDTGESRDESDGDGRDHSDSQPPDAVSQILGGQGGARDREFDIETEPPDAELDAHLDHLRKELDEENATELETLAEVVEETDDGRSIPKRCPEPHCDAAWAERGIIDIKTGRYELLEDGERVQCLECEEIHTLE